MNRTGLWSEILAPIAALLVAGTASLLRLPVLLVFLSIIWFGPAVLRRVSVVGALDERETEAYRVAQQVSLSVLLILVTILPFLLVSVREGRTVASEWLDVGFLVVAIFMIRALVIMHRTLPRPAAAHLAGAGATFIAAAGLWTLAAYGPGPIATWVLLSPIMCVVPHLVALKWRKLAAVLWLGGAALTAAWTVTTIASPLEQVITLGTLALPWAAAGVWIAKVSDGG
jgi:hypothetical protein